jgi:hypothetical protein
MRCLDNAARPQELQALAQGRARHSELVHEATLRRQRLASFQHTIDDQPLNPFSDHVNDLTRWHRSVGPQYLHFDCL